MKRNEESVQTQIKRLIDKSKMLFKTGTINFDDREFLIGNLATGDQLTQFLYETGTEYENKVRRQNVYYLDGGSFREISSFDLRQLKERLLMFPEL